MDVGLVDWVILDDFSSPPKSRELKGSIVVPSILAAFKLPELVREESDTKTASY